ncbi:MAG: HAD family hydrolase [Acetobacteraceae bacterium]|nr:HAD family hydrolase [Acetobacteraceae bacterium]
MVVLYPRPALLLYDWDNTLVDGWAGITISLNTAFDAFSLAHWSVQDTRERARVSMRESFPKLFGPDWQRARDIFLTTLAAQHLQHVRPINGAAALLDAGGAWVQGLVSNKTGRFLRAEVTHLGWDRHFRTIVGAGDAHADKPDPAPILLALRQLARPVDPTIWYLGDTESDMQAARAAGITAVLVGDAAHDGGVARAAPDIHFEDTHALAAMLRLLA